MSGCNVPALVLHASGDRVAPLSEGLELARTIAGARFVELDSANHILLAEEPAFRSFIAEVSAFANAALQGRAVVPADPRTRRQATILSADFRYADQAESLPPEVALERVDAMLERAAALVRENGGTVLTISENELVASFGAPEPLEGHAALACRTALGLRELALGHAGFDDRRPHCPGHRHRHRRPAGDQAAEVRGGPVSVAHGLSQALRPRSSSWRPPGPRHRPAASSACRRWRRRCCRNTPKDQQLFEVIEIRRGRSRWQLRAETQLSPFIGREMQLQILNKAWHDASDGEGQTVFVVGDPGLGKSRVTHEFVGAIPHDEAENLEVGALETDLRSGFVVIRKVLQALFGVGDTEAPAAAIEKVLAAQTRAGLRRTAPRSDHGDHGAARSGSGLGGHFRPGAVPPHAGGRGRASALSRPHEARRSAGRRPAMDGRRERGDPGAPGAGSAHCPLPAHPDLPAGI